MDDWEAKRAVQREEAVKLAWRERAERAEAALREIDAIDPDDYTPAEIEMKRIARAALSDEGDR